jgi:PAS domain-containing protein
MEERQDHPDVPSGEDREQVRGELFTLRTALDLVPVGIVLLDADTRAQFINRAFRRMWRLSDEKADSRAPVRRSDVSRS